MKNVFEILLRVIAKRDVDWELSFITHTILPFESISILEEFLQSFFGQLEGEVLSVTSFGLVLWLSHDAGLR